MKRITFLTVLLILIGGLSILLYIDFTRVFADIKDNIELEINKEYQISEFVESIANGKLKNGNDKIVFTKLGNESITIVFSNKINREYKIDIQVKVVDTIKPVIVNDKVITITEGSDINLLDYVVVTDNSNEEIIPVVIGKYDLQEVGTYSLKYQASDSSGNMEESDFELNIEPKQITSDTYYVKVNKTQNVVMVYEKDKDNNYTKLVKTFVISAGTNTPVGIFKVSSRHEVISFASGTYGHYATRITGPYWFHSVPYNSRASKNNTHWDDLLFNEYNKLGSFASAGCIRLSTADALWIYENIVSGTIIEIYESDILPTNITKPTPIKIDVNSENKGWDPTDPDPENPWHS